MRKKIIRLFYFFTLVGENNPPEINYITRERISTNSVLKITDEPQGSRDVEVGGQELARRTCSGSIGEFMRSWKTAIRPWSEFFHGSQISLPPCLDGYVTRVKKNLTFFLGNYFAITTILLLCSILTSFWLLVSTIILCMLIYMIRSRTIKGPIKVGEEEIPPWILYAAAIFITLPLFIFAHVGYIIYCAIGASIMLILLHATFYGNEMEVKSDADVEAQAEMTESAQMAANEQLIMQGRPIIRVTEPKTRVRFNEDESM
ncbi:unnamed protein product [Toxocara canis]|uniref:PRA1 family protein n=1 Tax=Toxocara canis TaxID=6265 RepID=A0A183TWH2_TOXCA|nr:unnamed protein product [Toxocara canis]